MAKNNDSKMTFGINRIDFDFLSQKEPPPYRTNSPRNLNSSVSATLALYRAAMRRS